MANFDSGVQGYVVGRAVVEVHFPIDWNGKVEIACKHCQFLSANERTCRLNGEMVAFPMKYVGDHCPLINIDDNAMIEEERKKVVEEKEKQNENIKENS